MYFMADKIIQESPDMIEADYERGLFGYTALLVGKFHGGKAEAIKNLQERGCIVSDKHITSEINFAVVGQSNAILTFDELKAKNIPSLKYSDALRLFTSEIRHPEALEL